MKRALLVTLILLTLLPGCYANYHHRYFTRLYRDNHPLLMWIAMYGTPMRIDYPRENAMLHVRIHFRIQGGHVHCRHFSGPAEDQTHGKNGDLVFTLEEWPEYRRLTELSGAEFVKEERWE